MSQYSRQQLFGSFVAPVRMVSQFEYCLRAREFSGGRLFVSVSDFRIAAIIHFHFSYR